jgi:hypothetical protein
MIDPMKTTTAMRRLLHRANLIARRLMLAAGFAAVAWQLRAADQTISGNLTVTWTVDVDGNTLTFGT